MTFVKPIIAVFSALFLFAIAAEAKKPNTDFTIPVPEGLTTNGSQTAIVKAALGRKWNIISKSNERVVINLVHRGYDSTLTFNIGESSIVIISDSWTTNKKGDRKKRKDPKGWIENLEKDINVYMNRILYG